MSTPSAILSFRRPQSLYSIYSDLQSVNVGPMQAYDQFPLEREHAQCPVGSILPVEEGTPR
jgi:hypothetical protein